MIEFAMKAVNEVAKVPFPIGYLNQALNYDRNKNIKPGVLPASIFFQKDGFGLIPKQEGDFDALAFDLLIDESHMLEFDVSDHAVENGAVISDHIQRRLMSIEVIGLFTNHSISRNAYVSDGKIKEKDSIELVDVESAKGQPVEGRPNECLEKWKALNQLAKQKSKVRLVTSLEVYDEMIIESLSTRRGPEDGDSIKFSLRLREIRTAKVEKKSITGVWEPPQPKKLEKPQQKAISKKKKKGKKAGKEVDVKAEANKLESLKNANLYTGGNVSKV